MGRYRQYDNDAERQRAYRERKAEELRRLRTGDGEEDREPDADAEIERLRKRVAELEAALAAKAAQASPSRPHGRGYAEPFPHVTCGIGSDDIASKHICEWFESRIIDGSMGTFVAQLVAKNLDWLAQAYWTNGGKPKPCKRLTYEQQAAVIAKRKSKPLPKSQR